MTPFDNTNDPKDDSWKQENSWSTDSNNLNKWYASHISVNYNGEWIPFHCRLCGCKIIEGEERNHIFETCGDCTPKVLNHIFKDLLKEENAFCPVCFRHIKACICPKKELLDKLKQ